MQQWAYVRLQHMKSGTVPCVCTNSPTAHVASVTEELYVASMLNWLYNFEPVTTPTSRMCGPA